ncbi:type I polyketide synthase [Amycolatopsis speibonae]|uniref:Type I polyketide synthase n=1 Tax=Amycolatopsis speibonae TaxID=1450224 RepID=A0ABV7PB09_9PSEU
MTAEPIAILGMACRYPGGVASPEDLWDLVSTGVDAIGEPPADRGWSRAPGVGGFLRGAGDFDADFFSISPREALAMDPQQRLLLETSWEAWERAGIDASALRGSDCGVFVGAAAQDYGPALDDPAERGSGHRWTGTSPAVASGRLSFFYGLRGPALTVDTAQSSSLVALHLACQALRAGECSTALAAGAAVIGDPGVFAEFGKLGALALDGRCKPFSAHADGTVWAEGVGVLVLRRLVDAQRDGDPVLAVIRSSALSHDGASERLTVPNGAAQEQVVRRALQLAGLVPSDVDMVEAHGTGTAIGDLTEAQALKAVYGHDRAQPLRIGSLKSNVGHAQAAAGVGGVIKAVMALRAGIMPKTLHVEAPCSEVDGSIVSVLAEQIAWPELGRPRRAGVSSFGISGTNAHLIVEQASPSPPSGTRPAGRVPWTVSARTAAALRARAAQLVTYVDERPDLDVRAVAWTLATGRAALPHQAVVLADDLAGFRAGLEALAHNRRADNVVQGVPGTEELEPVLPRLGDLPTYPFEREHLWLPKTSDDPVAVVAMSLRLPGGVDTPEALWDLMAAGRDVMSDFPRDRGWNLHTLKSYVRTGGFLGDIGSFDASFFGISPKEALAMDPQQRILLELSWEALERASIDPTSLRGSTTGVYVGMMEGDYASNAWADNDELGGYVGTGNYLSVASGRIAHILGLEGPALTIDTACSSSLVALHQACRALRSGESDLALAGGATIMSAPKIFIDFSHQRGLAPDGRCKPFSASADGTAFAEGAGMLVLERLSDARRHGHPVLALVRGSAVNSDGASNGLTAPSGPAQERVVTRALADARLTAADVDAVEAHGTGTKIGDPVEARALLATYGSARLPGQPLHLGSLKSVIGHTQAAAGVAGVIKMVLAMSKGVLPASLHIDDPTPHVDWSSGTVSLLTEARPWPVVGRARRAAVSGFGISGTNAHVILEAAPPPPDDHQPAPDHVLAWPLSARSQEALRAQASRLLDRVNHDPADIAHTLALGRAHHEHRAVVVGQDLGQITEALAALTGGHEHPGLVRGVVTGSEPKTAFVFPGQGSQYRGMARGLLNGTGSASHVFRRHVHACSAELASFVDWSLVEVLEQPPAEFERADVVQPALFAVMTGLAAVWRHHGIQPDAVVGHSQGEIAAAYVSGALSLRDAVKVVALRARALASLAGTGTMAQITAPIEVVETLLARTSLSIAAVNGPSAVVVSGNIGEIDRLMADCDHRGVHARRIPVDYASHSAHVDALEDEIRSLLADVEPQDSGIEFYSAMKGAAIDTGQLDGEYWYQSLRQPVNFLQATRALADNGFGLFLECSPHPVLAAALTESVEETGDARIVGTLRRNSDDEVELARNLAALHVSGKTPDWHTVGPAGRFVPLPTYAFDRRRYWKRPGSANADHGRLGQEPATHPMLGAVVELPDGGVCFTGRIGLEDFPWLADHAVAGVPVLPGTAYLDLALHAGRRAGASQVDELVVLAPLVLRESDVHELRVLVAKPGDDGRRELTVHTRSGRAWTLHASGVLSAGPATPVGTPPPPGAAVPLDHAYERLAAAGFAYGPAFRGVQALWREGDDLHAEVALPGDAGAFGIHPALLDAVLHASGLVPDGLLTRGGELNLPHSWEQVSLHSTGHRVVRADLALLGDDRARVTVLGANGELVLTAGSISFRPIGRAALARLAAADDCRHELRWIPAEDPGLVAAGHLTKVVAMDGDVHDVLVLVQDFLADDHLAATRLVLTTRSAVMTGPADAAPDLDAAAVWGLVKSAQAEHPGRLVLVDLDERPSSVLPRAIDSGEERFAVRGGTVFVPRLVPVPLHTAESTVDLDGAVLITGGTGTLGRIAARHLATRHGVRHLVLLSRSGPTALGAHEFEAELAELGCTTSTVACDAADADALAAVLDAIPADRPLKAVLHTAGVLDDASIGNLTREQVAAVMRPKAEAAWNLHVLTRYLGLSAFVLYSSVAGVLGTAGQAGYAAANSVLDALALRRRAEGLPATSLAWGYWAEESGMTGHLTATDLARLNRDTSLLPLSTADALAVLDDALLHPVPALVAARFSRPASAPRPPEPPAAGPVVRRLASMTKARQQNELVQLVRTHVAFVLGHTSSGAIDQNSSFRALGCDSLAAVEVRNRIAAATGLRLPATLVYDHPTPLALATHLRTKLAAEDDTATALSAPHPATVEDRITAVSDEELFQLIDEEL